MSDQTDRPYVTLPEWAEAQEVSVQRAHTLYKEGRLSGAYESGPRGRRGTILLPRLTPYPRDPRPAHVAPIVETSEGLIRLDGGD